MAIELPPKFDVTRWTTSEAARSGGGPMFFSWQICWHFCWYSMNQHLNKTTKSLKKSRFIWPLPGPPAFARFASFGQASPCHKRQAKRAKAVAPKPTGRRRTGAARTGSASRSSPQRPTTQPAPNQNVENNPMQSSKGSPAWMLSP